MQELQSRRSKDRPEVLTEKVYQTIKNGIFDFHLMLGHRFLHRLQQARLQPDLPTQFNNIQGSPR